MNIYEHISSNSRKTVVIVALFPLVLIVLMYATVWGIAAYMQRPDAVYTVAEQANAMSMQILPFVIGLAFLWILVSYLTGDQMMLNTAGAMEITKEDNPEVYSLVENMAKTAGLPMPKVFIVDDESSNAFATGRDPQHAAVALTTGIIKTLNKSELEGVIAHEMSHIGNRDIRLMMIVITGIGILSFLGQIMLRFAFLGGGRSRKSGGGAFGLAISLIGLVLVIYGVILAPLIMYALSRRREYQADATAALLTRDPAALASALEKISRDSRVEVLDSMPLMSSACIANAASTEGFAAALGGMFETHPPINKRIEALMQMDGR